MPEADPKMLKPLCEDLALALRAAAFHGLSEGVCNHFSVMLPDDSRRFLINPRGLHWSEIGPEDIVLVDEQGTVLQGRHRVEPTAMFIHAAAHRITGRAGADNEHVALFGQGRIAHRLDCRQPPHPRTRRRPPCPKPTRRC